MFGPHHCRNSQQRKWLLARWFVGSSFQSVLNSALCSEHPYVGHSVGQDPGVTPCRVWEGRGTTGCFVWRVHSLFLLEPIYLFTSLLGVDLVINTLALNVGGLIKVVSMSVSGSPTCLKGALFSVRCLLSQ